MKKIYIIGSVASGKTTLSKEISKTLRIPCFELDSIVHDKIEGRQTRRTPIEQIKEIDRIDGVGNWIIEGTYRKTCHKVLDIADTIVFLDTPLLLRMIRIVTRFIKQQFRIEKCNYKSDLKMLRLMFKWTNDFERDRDSFMDLLGEYSEKVYIVRNKKSLKNLLI